MAPERHAGCPLGRRGPRGPGRRAICRARRGARAPRGCPGQARSIRSAAVTEAARRRAAAKEHGRTLIAEAQRTPRRTDPRQQPPRMPPVRSPQNASEPRPELGGSGNCRTGRGAPARPDRPRFASRHARGSLRSRRAHHDHQMGGGQCALPRHGPATGRFRRGARTCDPANAGGRHRCPTTRHGHDVRSGQTLAQAQHAVVATTLWHTRVLAGWLPRGDARLRGCSPAASRWPTSTSASGRSMAAPPNRPSGSGAWPRRGRCSPGGVRGGHASPAVALGAWGTPAPTPPTVCGWACACPGGTGRERPAGALLGRRGRCADGRP